MRINKKQEIAMWVLGLIWIWMVFPFFYWNPRMGIKDFVWLVPIYLIIFSLRDRKKAN